MLMVTCFLRVYGLDLYKLHTTILIKASSPTPTWMIYILGNMFAFFKTGRQLDSVVGGAHQR